MMWIVSAPIWFVAAFVFALAVHVFCRAVKLANEDGDADSVAVYAFTAGGLAVAASLLASIAVVIGRL